MEKIALLPGWFKPPHAGHYNMAKWLATNTDADSIIIKVGSKVVLNEGKLMENESVYYVWKDNILKNAPHTMALLMNENWDYSYTKEKANSSKNSAISL